MSFPHQQFARYIQQQCDSKQDIDQNGLDERGGLYPIMQDFLGYHYPMNQFVFEREKFRPVEFGGKSAIDFSIYPNQGGDSKRIMIAEAKFMRDPKRAWGEEILNDIFRVACVRRDVTNNAERLVVVAGQEQCWNKALSQEYRLMRLICPLDRPVKGEPAPPLSFPIKLQKELDPAFLQDHFGFNLRNEIHDKLPESMEIVCVGCVRSSRAMDDNPQQGISVLIWKIDPKFSKNDSSELPLRD